MAYDDRLGCLCSRVIDTRYRRALHLRILFVLRRRNVRSYRLEKSVPALYRFV